MSKQAKAFELALKQEKQKAAAPLSRPEFKVRDRVVNLEGEVLEVKKIDISPIGTYWYRCEYPNGKSWRHYASELQAHTPPAQ